MHNIFRTTAKIILVTFLSFFVIACRPVASEEQKDISSNQELASPSEINCSMNIASFKGTSYEFSLQRNETLYDFRLKHTNGFSCNFAFDISNLKCTFHPERSTSLACTQAIPRTGNEGELLANNGGSVFMRTYDFDEVQKYYPTEPLLFEGKHYQSMEPVSGTEIFIHIWSEELSKQIPNDKYCMYGLATPNTDTLRFAFDAQRCTVENE